MSTSHPSPLHVEETGCGDPPLVLVHGFGAHGAFWRKWVPGLARSHRVMTVDLMGFGQADHPSGGDYSPLSQSRHLAELLRRMRGERPVLVGHSLGAGIAVATALRLQDEGGAWAPGGLVLVSGAVYHQKLPRYLSLARIRGLGELFLVAPPPRFLLRYGLRGIVHDPQTVDREQVETYRAPLRSLGRRRAILRAARQISPAEAEGLTARLGELSLPVLLVWGEEDRIVPPEMGRRLEKALPDARLVLLPRVGHLPPEEAPEASLEPVKRFLAELGDRRSRPSRPIAGGGAGGPPGPR